VTAGLVGIGLDQLDRDLSDAGDAMALGRRLHLVEQRRKSSTQSSSAFGHALRLQNAGKV
jgi:hypothetical protein